MHRHPTEAAVERLEDAAEARRGGGDQGIGGGEEILVLDGEFADEHGTSEQRAFNLLCIAYGADPEAFADVVKFGGLPDFRIEICEEEYELISYAYDTLIGPHIDPDLAKNNFDKTWLPEKTSQIFN